MLPSGLARGLAALLPDLGVVLRSVLLLDRFATPATDLSVEFGTVLALYGLPTLLPDLGVKLAPPFSRDGLPTLLADLRVELGPVLLLDRLTTLLASLSDGHLVLFGLGHGPDTSFPAQRWTPQTTTRPALRSSITTVRSPGWHPNRFGDGSQEACRPSGGGHRARNTGLLARPLPPRTIRSGWRPGPWLHSSPIERTRDVSWLWRSSGIAGRQRWCLVFRAAVSSLRTRSLGPWMLSST